MSALAPEEVDLLQECFHTILDRRKLPHDGDTADSVAKALITSYQRGVKDKNDLIRLADVGV